MKVDATQWHTYAVKWTPTEITTYVDGTPIFTTNDTSMFPPGPMHLAIQLDMLGPRHLRRSADAGGVGQRVFVGVDRLTDSKKSCRLK